MANNALSAIAANLAQGEWIKTTSADENLKTFNKYLVKYQRWMNICCRDIAMDDSQKLDLLLATAGADLEDLMIQAKVETRNEPQMDQVDGVEARDAIVANPNATLPVLAQQAVEAVAFTPAIVPTPWVVGIPKIRKEIRKYSNQIMARHELMFGMPAENYPNWRKWAQELIEQAKRCSWDEYGYEQAAPDALLYQCPNQSGKEKIMEGKMNFQECVDYGMTKLTANEEGRKISGGAKHERQEDSTIGKVEEKKTKACDCKRCFEKHEFRNCPAFGYHCLKCSAPNHLANSRECRNSKPPPEGAVRPPRGGQGRGDQRPKGRQRQPQRSRKQQQQRRRQDGQIQVGRKEDGIRSYQRWRSGKIWERDGILLKGKQIIVPKVLQAQSIAIAHEGHMQADGTL